MPLTVPTTPRIMPSYNDGGAFVMSEIGEIVFNEERGVYAVKLRWKGKRYYFSSYMGVSCTVKPWAEQLRAEIRSDVNKGIFNPLKYKKNKPLHLKTFAAKWLERKRASLASNTLHDYENSLENHIYPILGDPLLENINYEMLETLQIKIPRDNKGKKNVMYCLYAILRDAKRSGYISQLPDRPPFAGDFSVVPPEIKYIKSEDIDIILARIPEQDRSIIEFLIYTGCRPSEARALRKDDIKEDHVEIRWSFGRDQEDKLVKNRKPRKIPLFDRLKSVLENAPKNLTHYVFVNPRNGKHYGRDFSRIWRKAVKEAGLQPVQLRLLRHSFGCNLLNLPDGQIDREDLRRIYGHADIKMTTRYAERSTKALELKLNNVFDLTNKRANKTANRLQTNGNGDAKNK